MLAFIHDGTFEGFLSVVFDAYTLKMFPDIVVQEGAVLPLTVTRQYRVIASKDKADRVFSGYSKRTSREGRNVAVLAFLSEDENIGTLLFRYMRSIFDAPLRATHSKEGDFSDPVMLAVDRIAKKVSGERHHLMGFARFQKTTEGIYAAILGPRHNVLSLLVPHFTKRFSSHPWIIYDAKRGFGFFHDNGTIKDIYIEPGRITGNTLSEELLAPGEKNLEKMWQSYFAAAAVVERTNPTLQARCLPKRFWPYMTEMRK